MARGIVGGFQDEGQMAQGRVVDHRQDGLKAQGPLADLGVPVLPGAGRVHAVVDVDRLQPVQPHHPVQLLQHPVQVVDNVVARVGDVAGVQADPHFVGELHLGENRRQVLEPAADLAALPRHGLQEHHGLLLRLEDGVEHVRDHAAASLHPLAHVAAGVEVVVVPRQSLQHRQVPGHHLRRQSPDALVLGAGVHDVRGVGHKGPEAVLSQQHPQPLHV